MRGMRLRVHPLTPLMLALLLDIIGLFYGETLSSIFSFLVPAS